MGYYTKWELDVLLSEKTPAEVIHNLHVLLNYFPKDAPLSEPNHFLFKCERLNQMFHCNDDVKSRLYPDSGFWHLHVGGDFKNYGSEIEYFLDWLSPWVDPIHHGKEVGFIAGEDCHDWGGPRPIIFPYSKTGAGR